MTADAKWLDISVALHDGMVHWPSDPAVKITLMQAITDGYCANLTKLDMSAHTGTHMDAPRHYMERGISMEQMPLSAGMGAARVIAIEDPHEIGLSELMRHAPQAGERLLLKTRNSDHDWESVNFMPDFVALSVEAACYLAACKVQTVGVDYLSVGGYYSDGTATHRALLEAGIWIIEGLNLRQAGAGNYEIICLPLKIMGADGAPARAVLRPL
ncbi:MAG: cyclase family protein [Nitrospirota bacterium]|jgi:arylformamidase|nr:cyclase family protein [Nitrospirota bacterium]